MKCLIPALVFTCALAACAMLGPAERAQLAKDAANIEECQEIGRACKADGGSDCYGKYDDCMHGKGLK